jgi:hypothetical protein
MKLIYLCSPKTYVWKWDDRGSKEVNQVKKTQKYLVLFLPLILVGIIAAKNHWFSSGGIVLPTGETVSPEELRSQAVLKIVANQVNKALPRMVDQETKLRSVEALEGELKYNYDKINASSAEFDSSHFVDRMKPKAVQLACNSPDMQVFFANGVNARYSFHGSDHQLIGEILVTPVQCSY